MGDCPLCFLPLPFEYGGNHLYQCCNQFACDGCFVANIESKREDAEKHKCPFCRTFSVGVSREKIADYRAKRVEQNCPVAIRETGREAFFKNRLDEALQYFKRAAELGDIQAHFELATWFEGDVGFERKKRIKHLETAAIGGHPQARMYLAKEELANGQVKRSLDHLVIGTKQGCGESLEMLQALAEKVKVDKDLFTDALRGYQAAVDARKSPQREEAEVYFPKPKDE